MVGVQKVRSRWYHHFSSSSIAQLRAVCHSCKVLQSTMKWMKESDMDGQAKLFSFGFSRGRSGNRPEPNPSFSGLSEQIRKHSSSKESTRSPLEEEQRSRSHSLTAPSSIPGFDIERLLARRGVGEGISDADKLAYLKNGNGAIVRRFAFLKRFRLPATVQSKIAGRVPMAYILRIRGRRCLCTMRSVSSRCWAVDHKAHDQLDKSLNNPEGARCQQKAQRECVLGTLHSCKRKTPGLPSP